MKNVIKKTDNYSSTDFSYIAIKKTKKNHCFPKGNCHSALSKLTRAILTIAMLVASQAKAEDCRMSCDFRHSAEVGRIEELVSRGLLSNYTYGIRFRRSVNDHLDCVETCQAIENAVYEAQEALDKLCPRTDPACL